MTATTMSAYQPDRSLAGKVRRRLTRWQVAQPLEVQPQRTQICFTFDDFPKSAADTGAEILDEVGAAGCFYACTGMAETENQMGALFDARDIKALSQAGHEIGAHTESHMDCARTPANDVLADVDTNLARLTQMGLMEPVRQFAWPYGETRAGLKPKLASRFDAVRGVLSGPNARGADLMQLSAYELDEDEASIERAAAAIEKSASSPSWLFIFTHDVRDAHSPWGTTPASLRRLVRLARDTHAELVTPSMALDAIRAMHAA